MKILDEMKKSRKEGYAYGTNFRYWNGQCFECPITSHHPKILLPSYETMSVMGYYDQLARGLFRLRRGCIPRQAAIDLWEIAEEMAQ